MLSQRTVHPSFDLLPTLLLSVPLLEVLWSSQEHSCNSATGHFVWLVRSPGTVSQWIFILYLHYQPSKTCSRHNFSHVPTSLTNCFQSTSSELCTASTGEPHWHWCGMQRSRRSLNPTATLTASSSNFNPHEAMGSANSQFPLCWHEAAKNDARLYARQASTWALSL